MTSQIARDSQQTYGSQVESERGLLLALLVMVILGVAGIFAVSA